MEQAACVSCGTGNRPGRRFCRGCGIELGVACPSCGTIGEPSDRFCGSCGSAMDAGAGPDPAGITAASRPVAPAALERRFVSILFADLVGSTAAAEDADMEAVRDMLARYYALCREAIERYGGVVEKFIGDAVMAVWGTPVAHEDDAERAVRAALDLVDGARALRTPGGEPLAVRAGVLSGEAAANLGADGQALVAGDLVNTAARLQSVAPAAMVFVGEATMRASEAAIDYEPAGDHIVKGKSAPVAAWRAVRVAAGHGGSGRVHRLEPPFVGRDDELRLLKEVFNQCVRERRPRLVSITGVAGIGKTRLTWELEKYIDGMVETVYWHQGRSPAYGDGLAFWALGEMVRQRARIAEQDDHESARDKLAAMCVEYLTDAEERARVEPRLAALLGLEAAPPGTAEELTAAWRTLFERIADRGPTVLVFEDLHWADGGLLDFIEGLLGAARSRAILVMALARPELIESRPTWGATVRNHVRLDLAPLDDTAMEMLLVGMAPGIPPDAIAAIRARAAGIPLYAVETVRMLLDAGRLTETDGRFRLVGELGAIAVPDSLTALLGARLDALDPATRDLVGTCSVLGISFPASSVALVAARPEAEVRAVFDDLVRRELFAYDDDPRSPERGQHRFLQGVLREVAYARLSRRERQARHLAAAEALGKHAGDELAGVVATHFLEAVRVAADEDRESLRVRALDALEGAASRSRSIGAHASAARYLGDALELAEDEEARLRLREARLVELYAGSDGPGTIAEARVLLEAGRLRGDRGLIARAAYAEAGAHLNDGHPGEALRGLAEVRAELGDFVTVDPDGVQLLSELARCHLMAAQPEAAAPIIEEALTVAERLGLRSAIAELLASKGWAIGSLGRGVEAAVLLRGAVDFATREGSLRAEFRSRMNYSAWAFAEDAREALEVVREGIVRARQHGYDGWVFPLTGNAMSGALELGEWDWIARIAVEDQLEEQETAWALQAVAPYAMALAFRGEHERADRIVRRIDRVAEGLDDPQIRSGTHTTRSKVAYAAGDLATALREADLAEEISRDLHMSDEGWLLLLGMETRDPDRIAAAVSPDAPSARGTMAATRATRAARRVLAGDAAGLTAFDDACAETEAAGLAMTAALLRGARARMAPEDPGAGPAAEAAAAFYRRVGALPLLSLLTPFLGATPDASGPSTGAADPAAEASPA
jgi:class 3 adenylate cyclase